MLIRKVYLISKVQLRLIYENFVFCFFFALYIVLTEKGFSRFFFSFLFSQEMYTINCLVSGHPRELK